MQTQAQLNATEKLYITQASLKAAEMELATHQGAGKQVGTEVVEGSVVVAIK